jgi:hypothetical protein
MPSELDMTTAARAAARLSVSASEAELPVLITAASSALARYLGYPAHRRVGAVETVPGLGGVHLFLRAGAVQAIASITVNGTTLESTRYALDGEQGARMGRLVARQGYRWPFTGEASGGVSSTPYYSYDTGEIECTFTAGWVTPGQVALAAAESPPRTLTSDMPAELEQAVLEVVTAWHSGKGRDTRVASMSTGDASVSWGGGELPPLPAMARLLAEPYRKPVRRALG